MITPDAEILDRIMPREHHKKCGFCETRAKYREGKKPRAVKVYTVNDESRNMLLQNVPSIGLVKEVEKLCKRFKPQIIHPISESDYPPPEDFTQAYYLKFGSIRNARAAKKHLDEREFFGQILHVCYAPELETVSETREKLLDRLSFVQSPRVGSTGSQIKVKKGAPRTNQTFMSSSSKASSTPGDNPLSSVTSFQTLAFPQRIPTHLQDEEGVWGLNSQLESSLFLPPPPHPSALGIPFLGLSSGSSGGFFPIEHITPIANKERNAPDLYGRVRLEEATESSSPGFNSPSSAKRKRIDEPQCWSENNRALTSQAIGKTTSFVAEKEQGSHQKSTSSLEPVTKPEMRGGETIKMHSLSSQQQCQPPTSFNINNIILRHLPPTMQKQPNRIVFHKP